MLSKVFNAQNAIILTVVIFVALFMWTAHLTGSQVIPEMRKAHSAEIVNVEKMAKRCAMCHKKTSDPAKPKDALMERLSPEAFIEAMTAYDKGDRKNGMMKKQAKKLSDEEIAALAAYFAPKS